jgi:Arc/MetJ-type ribon-helix-helix transcriptional regulator
MSWPTTDDPKTEFITVRFTASEAADIEWLTGHTNAKNRSAAVRAAVDRVVSAEKRAARRAKAADAVPDESQA